MNSNHEIELAGRYVTATGMSVFLTGKAGTGKTTFLHYIVDKCHKRSVVVAPTGVAAVNAGGVTIHSFFQLPLCPYLPDVPELVTEYQMPESRRQLRKSKVDIIRTMELLIIDEISMVRADLLDAVDSVLRRYRRSGRPFGGVQLLMIGDVQQLAPVVTDEEKPYMDRVYPSPFFFHSKALQKLQYVTIQLKTIYRQQDRDFVDVLNKIRDNCIDGETLHLLNSRVGAAKVASDGQEPILLTTHNRQADEVNRRHMEALNTPSFHFEAVVEGNFPDSSMPTERSLELKIGAQVMFVKNDSNGHRYYNGMIGRVNDIVSVEDGDTGTERIVEVDTGGGGIVFVMPDRWENVKYEIDKKDNQIKPVVDGSFVQYPLKTAWAITIHKAQGLTFDRVQVDASKAFTYGQVYVALSRCRSLEGLTLLSPITLNNVFGSEDIDHFNASMTPQEQVEQMLDSCQKQYFFDVLFELFDFSGVQHSIEGLERIYQDLLRALYPDEALMLTTLCSNELNAMVAVSDRFKRQLATIGQQEGAEELLKERISKAVAYFGQQLRSIDEHVRPVLAVSIDNKTTAERLRNVAERYKADIGLKIRLMEHVAQQGFSIEGYQREKVDFTLQKPEKERVRKSDASENSEGRSGLVARLAAWRKDKAEDLGQPLFVILHQKTMLAIAKSLPLTKADLLAVPGMGKVKVNQFGDEILQVVADYCHDNNIVMSVSEPVAETKTEPIWKKAVAMVAEGKSIKEVAEELSRAPSTVEGYVFKAVQEGVMDVDLVVASEDQDILVSYFMEQEASHPLKEVFEHFEGRYSYLQLRIARYLADSMR